MLQQSKLNESNHQLDAEKCYSQLLRKKGEKIWLCHDMFFNLSLLTFMQWYVALAAQTKLLLGQPSKSESSPQMRPSPA